MKTHLILAISLAIVSITSCIKDSGSELGIEKDNNVLQGTWNLTQSGDMFDHVALEPGEHVWTFDVDQNTLFVEGAPVENYSLMDEGQYSISIDIENQQLTILDHQWDYAIEEDELTLADQPELDGPIRIFERQD